MPGLLRGVARTAVVAGTATAVSGRVARRQQGRWAAQEAQQQTYAQPEPVAAQPAPQQDDLLSQLSKLGELKNAGVLTEDEFSAAKAKLLGS